MNFSIFLIFLFLTSVASTNLLAADAIPVTRINITNEAEDRVADVVTTDLKRLAVTVDGAVITTPGGVGDILILNFLNGGSPDMRVDGSTTPVVFTFPCDASKDSFINEIRMFGGCNGIKFGQHLCKNTTLTNGIKIEIRSDAQTLVLPLMENTEDYKNKMSFGPGGPGGHFRIDVQSGADQFVAGFNFGTPAIIRKCGTAPTPDDFIAITIQDDLTGSQGGNLQEFSGLVQGFKR